MLNKNNNFTNAIASVLLFTTIAITTSSCNLFSSPEKELTANDYIYAKFKEWYLWYDQIPDLDPSNYETPHDLIAKIRIPQDKWSNSLSLSKWEKLINSGEYKGFGAGFMLDFDNQVKINKIYKKSPLGELGVQRGWIVNTVNGYGAENLEKFNQGLSSDEDVKFEMTDLNNTPHNFIVRRKIIEINTVLHSSVIEKENHKIGYLVFDSFLQISLNELYNEFQKFHDENITDLIVDLRYNGGGLNSVAYELIGMIGGDKVSGQIVSKTVYNDKKENNNFVAISDYEGPRVNVNRVYFITTSGTASSSELVINALSPFMEVKLIGSDTHGKPVGMNIIKNKDLDLAVLPVSFKNVNRDDYGEFYNGLPADIIEIDDLTCNWGNPEEKNLKAAINDIIGNSEVSSIVKSVQTEKQRPLNYSGLHQIINAY